jgi:hypothetical protein
MVFLFIRMSYADVIGYQFISIFHVKIAYIKEVTDMNHLPRPVTTNVTRNYSKITFMDRL